MSTLYPARRPSMATSAKMAEAAREGRPLTPKMVADGGDGSGNETSAKDGLGTI